MVSLNIMLLFNVFLCLIFLGTGISAFSLVGRNKLANKWFHLFVHIIDMTNVSEVS